ncbi:MAG TPA: hypothetical protein VG895_05125 [Patescibacteria group bacterium]|nr:hypothetical protein [Patescibacteria group bacterium]
MKLPKYLTTVTTFSKLLALILFFTMPVIAFELGGYFEMIQLMK